MTQIDEQIDNILLEHIVLATDNGQPYIKSTDTAVEAIKALISDQVAKAKIEEIDAIPDYGLEEPTDYACYDLNHQFNRCVSCYKKMRLATLNGVNNNE